MFVKDLLNIFNNNCEYNEINKNTKHKMRKVNNGISLGDLFLFRFSYAKKDNTKERIVSKLNYRNNTDKQFTRQGYECKEKNINVKSYSNLFKSLVNYFNCTYNENGYKLIAVDGTYNNDNKMNELLNMGFYDVTNGIPIDIKSYGKEGKNKEIASAINYINSNMHLFKNNILVGDRGYYSYKFIKFLIDNNIKFIMRTKWSANKLNPNNIVSPKTKDYDAIMAVRNNSRLVKHDAIMHKTIYASNTKKNIRKHSIQIKNNCTFVTNLNGEEFTDNKILELYKSRWDIEVFFKFVKTNFKFQHMNEKKRSNYNKMYFCELIITYIAKLIEKYYIDKNKIILNKKGTVYKINKSNLVNGIFDVLLFEIFDSTLTEQKLDDFCKSYIKIIQNKTDRHFPRNSKTPFTKWYIKGYSNQTKYLSIIDAIINDKVNELNKNLKTIAKLIIVIDGIKYG